MVISTFGTGTECRNTGVIASNQATYCNTDSHIISVHQHTYILSILLYFPHVIGLKVSVYVSIWSLFKNIEVSHILLCMCIVSIILLYCYLGQPLQLFGEGENSFPIYSSLAPSSLPYYCFGNTLRISRLLLSDL